MMSELLDKMDKQSAELIWSSLALKRLIGMSLIGEGMLRQLLIKKEKQVVEMLKKRFPKTNFSFNSECNLTHNDEVKKTELTTKILFKG
jgi:hypothetical protein